MRHIISVVLFISCIVKAVAQPGQNPALPARDLSIQWEAVQNDYQNRTKSLNAIIITNNSSTELPASGWKMYFNSARLFDSAAVKGNVRFDFINGDLFCMTPEPGFQALKPGASTRIEYVAQEPVVNITDGPEGFYLVWDAKPDTGYPTGRFTTNPFKPTYKGLVTAGVIYNQNKMIRDIPMEKLTKIFPTPVSYQETSGFFNLTTYTQLQLDDRFKSEEKNLSGTLVTLLGKRMKGGKTGNAISLEFKSGIPDEGYELEVKPESIVISASGTTGIFYGIQSLKTLIPPAAWRSIQQSI